MSGIWSGPFFVSAEICDSRNWNSPSNIASFERRLRGAAPTPLALPCPFRTLTRTRTDAERDKREVAKIPHVEEEFRRFWLSLNVCNAWMIYKIGIISKRYLIMFGILRWHMQLSIVWSQIVHQMCLIARAWMINKIGIIYKRYLLDNV